MCEPDEMYAWDAKLLENIDLSEFGIKFEGNFKPTNPEHKIVVRPLSSADFDRGFTDVLAQLTRLGSVSKDDFIERFNSMKTVGGYYTIVVEDTQANNGKGKIVATATLEIEEKFIHSCALGPRLLGADNLPAKLILSAPKRRAPVFHKATCNLQRLLTIEQLTKLLFRKQRGRVEELIVDSEYRNRQFNKILLGLVNKLGQKLTCYKISLECTVEDLSFYEMFGYKQDPEKFMQLRFRD